MTLNSFYIASDDKKTEAKMCHTICKSIGNYYYFNCGEISDDVQKEAEKFCKSMIKTGTDPDTGIVINAENEIRYLTFGEVVGGCLLEKHVQECDYILEF